MRQLFYHSSATWSGVDAWLNHVDQWYRQAPDHRPPTWPESVHSSIDITRQGHNRRLSLAEYAVSSRVPLELPALLDPIVQDAVRYFDLQDLGDFDIQEIWYNAYGSGQSQQPHRHSGVATWLSGVYYAAFDPGLHTATRFFHPGFQWDISDLGYPGCVTYQPGVTPGSVIVFPSEILHDVPPQDSDQLRVTVSFNVMLTVKSRVRYG